MPKFVLTNVEQSVELVVEWSWNEFIGDIRNRINQTYKLKNNIKEGEMIHGPLSLSDTKIIHGPLDNTLIIEEFQDIIKFAISSSTNLDKWRNITPKNNPIIDQIEIRMQTLQDLSSNSNKAEKICLFFPGQGTQHIGMANQLLEGAGSEIVRDIFNRASEILNYDLLDICMNGPIEKLNSTIISQLAVLVTSIAAIEKTKFLQPNIFDSVSVVAGLSCGEYSALVFSGALSFEDGVRLVKSRAEAMQKSSELNPGGMVTIVGLDDEKINSLCEQALKSSTQPKTEFTTIKIANYLFPKGRVVSGDIYLCDYIEKEALNYNPTLVRKLKVSGAFHSIHMKSSSTHLKKALDTTNFVLSKNIKVFSNVTGKKYESVEEIKELLVQQLSMPVLWENIINEIISNENIEKYIDVGPGKEIKAMIKRTNNEAFLKTENLM